MSERPYSRVPNDVDDGVPNDVTNNVELTPVNVTSDTKQFMDEQDFGTIVDMSDNQPSNEHQDTTRRAEQKADMPPQSTIRQSWFIQNCYNFFSINDVNRPNNSMIWSNHVLFTADITTTQDHETRLQLVRKMQGMYCSYMFMMLWLLFGLYMYYCVFRIVPTTAVHLTVDLTPIMIVREEDTQYLLTVFCSYEVSDIHYSCILTDKYVGNWQYVNNIKTGFINYTMDGGFYTRQPYICMSPNETDYMSLFIKGCAAVIIIGIMIFIFNYMKLHSIKMTSLRFLRVT